MKHQEIAPVGTHKKSPWTTREEIHLDIHCEHGHEKSEEKLHHIMINDQEAKQRAPAAAAAGMAGASAWAAVVCRRVLGACPAPGAPGGHSSCSR